MWSIGLNRSALNQLSIFVSNPSESPSKIFLSVSPISDESRTKTLRCFTGGGPDSCQRYYSLADQQPLDSRSSLYRASSWCRRRRAARNDRFDLQRRSPGQADRWESIGSRHYRTSIILLWQRTPSHLQTFKTVSRWCYQCDTTCHQPRWVGLRCQADSWLGQVPVPLVPASPKMGINPVSP